MKRDYWLAAVLLAAACLAHGCIKSTDWGAVWIYEIKPWIHWDFKPPGKPVGEDLKVENGQKNYAGNVHSVR